MNSGSSSTPTHDAEHRASYLRVLSSPNKFADYLANELAFLSEEPIQQLHPDTDLVADLGFDSFTMLELFEILDSLLGPEAAFDFDLKTMGTTVRSIYLYCLASLQKPLKELDR